MLSNDPALTFAYMMLIAANTLNFFILIPPNIQVLFQTPLIVYIASIHSLRLYCTSTDIQKEGVETMSKKDAMLFPVFAGSALVGLFLVFKYFDPDNVNLLFHYYFTFIGTVVIAQFFYTRFSVYSNLSKNVLFSIPKIPFLSDEPIQFDVLYLIMFCLSSIVGTGYFMTKHYYLNNVFGIFFSLIGIESFMIGSTSVGVLLLSLLFFYDIYFVFFTPIMVSVATNLDGPIKLMFPKIFDWETKKDFNMIGLGDIVLPGIFVALTFRYDYIKTVQKLKALNSALIKDNFGNYVVDFNFSNFKTFLSCFFGYVFGILATLIVMNVFKAAQPALLYLVPGVVIFSLICSLLGGYFMDFFNFSEDDSLESILGIVTKKKEEEIKTEIKPEDKTK